jgi:hypothetical protein
MRVAQSIIEESAGLPRVIHGQLAGRRKIDDGFWELRWNRVDIESQGFLVEVS